VIALGAMLLASFILYVLSKDTMTATYRYHHLSLHETAGAILPAMIFTNIAVLLGLIAATILVTLYFSHKISGPLHRLGKVLEEIGGGNLNVDMEFRRRDQLKDLVPQINNMTQNLNKRVQRIQDAVSDLYEKTHATDWKEDEIGTDIEKLQKTVYELFETEQ
jgi:nitrogen fixation/metabolism regulation signal transduction histidine kinase